MNCIYHPERDATNTCENCRGGVCEFCKTVVDGIIYCPTCVDKMLAGPSKAARTHVGQPAAAAPSEPSVRPSAPPSIGAEVPYAARPGGVVEGTSWFRALGMLVISACGAIAIAGVFMPWEQQEEWIIYSGHPVIQSTSGWEMAKDCSFMGEKFGVICITANLVIIGAGLMLACALPATFLALTSTKYQNIVRTMAKVSAFGAVIVMLAFMLTLLIMLGTPVSYGVLVIFVASLVGLTTSVLMSRWRSGRSRFYLRNG